LQDQWRDNREEEDMKRAMQESIAEMDPFAVRINFAIIKWNSISFFFSISQHLT